jgi:hypothetical protein
MRFTITLSDKYDSGEASQDNCEAYLSFCESNDTLPRAPFTVYSEDSFETYSVAVLRIRIILMRLREGRKRMRFRP